MSQECKGCSSKTCSSVEKERENNHVENLENDDNSAVDKAMSRIKHKVVVLSGKGGVGKSTVAAALAWRLAAKGSKVGLMDTDMHGPSIPVIFGLNDDKPEFDGDRIIPVEIGDLKIISTAFFLSSRTDSVIWRGPMKTGIIKQFLQNVEWGDLDYLIIDSPPGTGDEPLSVCQMIPDADGALIVTTPQNLSTADVHRSIDFCRKLKFPIIGIVENMSGFVCPHCGNETDIFKSGGGRMMAKAEGIPFLGTLPVNMSIMESCDAGRGFAGMGAGGSQVFDEIVANFENNIK